jgi:transmembrane 9 superfamily protein 2/4
MAQQRLLAAGLLAVALLASSAHAFYLPGVAPQDFAKASAGCRRAGTRSPSRAPAVHRVVRCVQGDKITLKVNKLTSVKNLPYEYYSLPYCRPDKIISSAENLGEVLRGDRIENSPYQVMLQHVLDASQIAIAPPRRARLA